MEQEPLGILTDLVLLMKIVCYLYYMDSHKTFSDEQYRHIDRYTYTYIHISSTSDRPELMLCVLYKCKALCAGPELYSFFVRGYMASLCHAGVRKSVQHTGCCALSCPASRCRNNIMSAMYPESISTPVCSV